MPICDSFLKAHTLFVFEEAYSVIELILACLLLVGRVELLDHGVVNAVFLEAADDKCGESDDEGEVTTKLL